MSAPQLSGRVDDSFVELWFKAGLAWVERRLCATRFLMRVLVGPPFYMQRLGWAHEEAAIIALMLLTYSILPWDWLAEPAPVFAALLIVYAFARVIDIFAYELRIVFIDRHLPYQEGGLLLSVDRRILLAFVRIADFFGVFAVLFLGMQSIGGINTFDPAINSPVQSFYFSVTAGSFTGLATSTPRTDWAKLAVASEILLALLLFTLLLGAIVGSIGKLDEVTDRPPRLVRGRGNEKASSDP